MATYNVSAIMTKPSILVNMSIAWPASLNQKIKMATPALTRAPVSVFIPDSTFKPKTNLARLFPLKTKQHVTAGFDVAMEGGTEKVRTVELLILDQGELYVGGCKYKILKIERRQSRSNGSPNFTNIDYYAPDLKLVIAKEYKEANGRTSLIKFDKIYPINR